MEVLITFIEVLITTLLILGLVFILLTNYWITKLINGQLEGTFDGFIGEYILKTFRKTSIYYKGAGLPVTLTKRDYLERLKGTVIFLEEPYFVEKSRCEFSQFDFTTFAKNDLWWTKTISRNKEVNDFGRFNNELDELLTVPVWYFKIKF